MGLRVSCLGALSRSLYLLEFHVRSRRNSDRVTTMENCSLAHHPEKHTTHSWKLGYHRCISSPKRGRYRQMATSAIGIIIIARAHSLVYRLKLCRTTRVKALTDKRSCAVLLGMKDTHVRQSRKRERPMNSSRECPMACLRNKFCWNTSCYVQIPSTS